MATEAMICLDKFLKDVKSELTVSCQLPVNIPNQEIIRIIKQAKKWFYKNYEDSVEEKYYVIHSSTWTEDEFMNTKTVQLPDTVFSVHGVNEIGRENFSSIVGNDPDFMIDKFVYGSFYGSGDAGGMPARSSENMMYYVVNEMFWDMARQVFIAKISFNYNRLTHNLRFMGKLPRDHVILQIYETIDDCSLFDDEVFYRWVVAHCKVQISRVLGTFNYNLPGGIQINYDIIRDEGKEDIENIKEEIKSQEGTDYFLVS